MTRGRTAEAGPPTAGASPTPNPPSPPSTDAADWNLGVRRLHLERPRVMGILNLTPDSFSDGGELASVEAALGRAESMVGAGADILDVGGESTRPGAAPVPSSEEIRRIVPFIRIAASRFSVPVSVDTRKAEVAEAALDAGATIVNDVSGLEHDPRMAGVVAERGVGVVLMHMRGTPSTMRELTDYRDVARDVRDELARRMDAALEAGIEADRIVVDPGIGFAKNAEQSFTLIRDLDVLGRLGRPVLVGPGRKSFLGSVLGTPPDDRLEGTLAACVAAYLRGARIFRVHDVEPVVRALAVARAVLRGSDSHGDENRGEEEGRRMETAR